MAHDHDQNCLELWDDGTLDTVLRCMKTGERFRFSAEASEGYRDPSGHLADLDEFIEDQIATGAFDL